MAKNENTRNYDKIESVEKDLKANIGKVDGEAAKRSEMQHHYATKYFVLMSAALFFASICGAYAFVTPMMIDSKNSKFEHKLNEVLAILKPTNDNKTK